MTKRQMMSNCKTITYSYGNCYYIEKWAVEEYIEELEELIKPKNCDGCFHNSTYRFQGLDSICAKCSRHHKDRYETKERL